MRKLALIGSLVAALVFVKPGVIHAQEICTTVYGGGVVCGASTEHKPVDTAFGDINPAVLGAGLLLLSRGFSYLSKRLKSQDLEVEA